jgi:hypothetical protein
VVAVVAAVVMASQADMVVAVDLEVVDIAAVVIVKSPHLLCLHTQDISVDDSDIKSMQEN